MLYFFYHKWSVTPYRKPKNAGNTNVAEARNIRLPMSIRTLLANPSSPGKFSIEVQKFEGFQAL